jgi:uncharacterized membrane protein
VRSRFVDASPRFYNRRRNALARTTDVDLSRFPLHGAWTLAVWALAVPMLLAALCGVRWREVVDGPAARVWPAAVAAVVGLWSLRAGVGFPLVFHLSGIAALALACGFPLALAGGAVVVAASSALFGAPWSGAALVWLGGVALPAAVATLVRRFADRRLPHNVFVYVFVVAYFGALAASVSISLAGTALAFALFDTPAAQAFGDWLVVLATLAFGEALLTGMFATLAVVYRPHWIATFDARRHGLRP